MVSIRRGRQEDLPSLLVLWRAAVEDSHLFLATSDVDWYEQLVAGYLPRMGDLRVAVQDGSVVGFIAQEAGNVHMLFVSPAAQGVGVGTALLNDVAGTEPVLRLDVNEQNPRARRFYAARGFVEAGRSPVDGQGRPFPLIHLRRP